LLLEEGGGYEAVEVDRELAGSLFSRLFFFKGKGLRYFKPYTDNNDRKNYIGVFEINWTGNGQ